MTRKLLWAKCTWQAHHPYDEMLMTCKKYHSFCSSSCSFVGFFSRPGLRIGESHIKFFRSLDDSQSFAGTNSLRNFTTINPIVHEKQFNVSFVFNKEFFEPICEHIYRLLVLLAT